MLGSKLIPNVLILSTIACWTTISWGPALADQVVLMSVPASLGGDDDRNEVTQEFGGFHDWGEVVRNSDLEMGYERLEAYQEDGPDTPNRVALRYEGINIPAGATITGAHIQFMADDEPDKSTWSPPLDPELGTGTFAPLEASFSIYGYLNPTTPANSPPPLPPPPFNQELLGNKYLLTNSTGGQCANPVGSCSGGTGPKGGVGSEIINVTDPVHWIDVPTWTTGDVNGDGTIDPLVDYLEIGGTAGPDQRTPDLKSIVQHIVDLPGWASGNAMTFYIDPMVEVAGPAPGIDDDTFFRGIRTAVSMFCGPAANRCLEIKARGITPTPPVLTIDFTTDTTLDGDHNEDGTVDAADYVAWRKSPSLFDGDPAGYNLWRQHFAEGDAGASPSGAVPEPGCCALIVSIVVASLVACRRSVH